MITRTKKIIKGQRSSNQRITWFFLVLCVVLAIVFLAYSNLRMYRQRAELKIQLEKVDHEVAVLLEKNILLKKGIGDLSDPTKIEEAARDKLIMRKPGEEVVVVIPPEEKPVPSEEKKLNWWQKIIKKLGL